MDYRLYYKYHFIATVKVVDSDFPNMYGYFQVADFTGTDSEIALIQEYIHYSIELSKCDEEEEKFDELNKAWKYDELLNSSAWKMEAEDGRIIAILLPDFGENQQIVWRYS